MTKTEYLFALMRNQPDDEELQLVRLIPNLHHALRQMQRDMNELHKQEHTDNEQQ